MPFLGNQPSVGYSTIVKDDFTGNGSTTDFTLSKSVASANDIAVFVGNVRQEPTEAYTVNGTTLTMSAAPSSSDNFYVLHLASAITSSTVPATGTITSGMLTSGSVTSAKLDTNIDIAGTLDVTGALTADSNATVAGNLTVDTNTLYVDATNNRVGIGTSSPSYDLDVLNTTAGCNFRVRSTNAGSGAVIQVDGSGAGSYPGYHLRQSGTHYWSIQQRGDTNLHLRRENGSGGIITNGAGISFDNGSNYLDDYEEGNWTATLDGSTSGPSSLVQVSGDYVKVGRLVYVACYFANVNTSGASGGVRITGLPYVPNQGNQMTGNWGHVNIATWGGTNISNISPFLTATYIAFYSAESGGAWAEISHSAGTGRYLNFSGIYRTS